MKRLLPVVAVLLAVPLLDASAASSEPARAAVKATECKIPYSDERPARLVFVTGLSCKAGLALAARVTRRAPRGCVKVLDKRNHITLIKPCTRQGYRCTARSIVAGLGVDVKCRKDARRLTFQY